MDELLHSLLLSTSLTYVWNLNITLLVFNRQLPSQSYRKCIFLIFPITYLIMGKNAPTMTFSRCPTNLECIQIDAHSKG